jgi:SAM-dependent methyltransferase
MAPRSKSSSASRPDPVKQQVAAHWDRRAPTFDEDFGHSIRTPDERAAWDRILDLVVGGRAALDALDAGCGTGFLAFELTDRGHRVTGVDFAPAMIAQARRKALDRGVSIRFRGGHRAAVIFALTFDLVIDRHCCDAAASGGRIDEEDPGAAVYAHVPWSSPTLPWVTVAFHGPAFSDTSKEYAAIEDQLPFLSGRSREQIEGVFSAHGLANVRSDDLLDLVAAQTRRMIDEGRVPPQRRRYVVWGDLAG